MPRLTDAQQELQARARAFAMERVKPLADELDPRREDIPRSLLDEIAAEGWMGITVEREHGGLGLGVLDYCLVIEELARAWLSVASVVGRANSHLADALGSDERRATLMPRVARGDFLGAFALSEDEAGSDVAAIRTRAEEQPDGTWRVSGTKKWCGFAKAADYVLLFARTDEAPEGKPYLGLSAFLVEKERDTFPAGVTGTPVNKIGYFGLTSWRLEIDGLELPAGALLGERGKAFYGVMAGLDRKRVYTAARAVGLSRGALEDAVDYARRRHQFGQPIADFQAVRFMLADMAAETEAARTLCHDVARRYDEGQRVTAEAAMAKLFATEAAERITSAGLQVHGGNGYLEDFPAQRYWRDARLTRIFEGTSEIQRRIVSDRLLADTPAPTT